MCKALKYNFCKQRLNKSTSVSNAQNSSVKFNMVIKAQSANGGLCLIVNKKETAMNI